MTDPVRSHAVAKAFIGMMLVPLHLGCGADDKNIDADAGGAPGAQDDNDNDGDNDSDSGGSAGNIKVATGALSDVALAALTGGQRSLVAHAGWQLMEPDGSWGAVFITGDAAPLTYGADEAGFLAYRAEVSFDAPPAAALVEQDGVLFGVPQVIILDETVDLADIDVLDTAALADSAILGVTSTELIYVDPDTATPDLEAQGYTGVVINTAYEDGTRPSEASVGTTTVADWEENFGFDAVSLTHDLDS